MKFESELNIVLDMLRNATVHDPDKWITINRRDVMRLAKASGYGALIILHHLRYHPNVIVCRETKMSLFRYNDYRQQYIKRAD